jgi:uncharacterized membrane protein YhhN
VGGRPRRGRDDVTGPAFLLLSLAMVAAVVDWVAVDRDAIALEYLCKPLTLALLLAAALAVDPADPAVRGWFTLALVLCLLGDVLLMLPQDRFVPGLIAFLFGHLAYIVGMHLDGVDAARAGLGVVVVLIAIATIGRRVLTAVGAGDEPELRLPVLTYMSVISLMVVSAIGTGRPAAIVGAGLFYASDSLIAWNRFVHASRRGRLAVMVTYHLAQVGLVLSLL